MGWTMAGPGASEGLLAQASAPADAPELAQRLIAGLGPGPFAAVLVFASPKAEFRALMADMARALPATVLAGCTTAGEITSQGYAEGSVIAIGLPEWGFDAEPLVIPDLGQIDGQALVGQMIRMRHALEARRPDWGGEFAFLLVDGMSRREDALVAAISHGLGPVPLFGGSAGDGMRFGQTLIAAEGQVMHNAAVLLFLRSQYRVKVFNLDHQEPTGRRMVVTGADPRARIVHEINAEPAAQEYARLLGKDPGQLTSFTFAAHPVVVRIGGQHHVRSIQRMDENGHLHFFSAIDEGLVLTLANPKPMVSHLAAELAALGQGPDGPPAAILACDCILRRIEAEEKQMTGEISALLRRHRVLGFSTYGEQLGGRHVNQTMTGVAIYAPMALGQGTP